jgi:hypothetical protein
LSFGAKCLSKQAELLASASGASWGARVGTCAVINPSADRAEVRRGAQKK